MEFLFEGSTSESLSELREARVKTQMGRCREKCLLTEATGSGREVLNYRFLLLGEQPGVDFLIYFR